MVVAAGVATAAGGLPVALRPGTSMALPVAEAAAAGAAAAAVAATTARGRQRNAIDTRLWKSVSL